ncbi:uncharacterized protein LOC112570348 [Pomacea canaliculata]|uniref:uncharacterized protein LOC112570348 n=1 Tax=Pomacea canaliculata TaxID=400727 RepID=UPI000D73156B|nr:uncharacterized protein LOC112570348 [Pomacea canaliculata]
MGSVNAITTHLRAEGRQSRHSLTPNKRIPGGLALLSAFVNKTNTVCVEKIAAPRWAVGVSDVDAGVVVVPTHGRPSCPPGGSYFDEYTNRNECCEDLCKYAKDDISKQLCKLKCPGYDAETKFRAVGNGMVKEAGSDPQLAPPPPPNPTRPPEEHDGDDGSEMGAIIGIVIALIAVAAVSGVVVALVHRRLRRTRGSNDASPTKTTKPTNSPIYTKVAKVDNPTKVDNS